MRYMPEIHYTFYKYTFLYIILNVLLLYMFSLFYQVYPKPYSTDERDLGAGFMGRIPPIVVISVFQNQKFNKLSPNVYSSYENVQPHKHNCIKYSMSWGILIGANIVALTPSSEHCKFNPQLFQSTVARSPRQHNSHTLCVGSQVLPTLLVNIGIY